MSCVVSQLGRCCVVFVRSARLETPQSVELHSSITLESMFVLYVLYSMCDPGTKHSCPISSCLSSASARISKAGRKPLSRCSHRTMIHLPSHNLRFTSVSYTRRSAMTPARLGNRDFKWPCSPGLSVRLQGRAPASWPQSESLQTSLGELSSKTQEPRASEISFKPACLLTDLACKT